MGMRLLALLVLLKLEEGFVDACCRGSKPDPTFVDSSEYYLTSITPNRGTLDGGARVTIKGGGFNTNFFTSGNYAYIGSDDTEWVALDVFAGACTVQCGGPNTLIADTGPWTYGNFRSNGGWLDLKVYIEVFADDGAGEMVELILENAYYYYNNAYRYTPMLLEVSPHAASSEESLTIKGNNFGYWIQDYRIVYVGSGRAPQGANINDGTADTDALSTHAVCRPEDLNSVHNPNEPDLTSTTDSPVMPEDRNADPITEDQLICALGDFMAGSYNVSVYMINDKRASGASSQYYVPGLASVYDYDDYYEASLFSYDASGVLHMVQYYPRIDSVFPTSGSTEGGTVVTIEGGGFAMNEADGYVMIDNRKCVITYSSIEKIVCNTTAQANVTIPTKVMNIDHGVASGSVDDVWMTTSQVVGNWTEVSSTSAYENSYLKFSSGDDQPGSGWVTFIPNPEENNLDGSLNISGVYQLFLHVPAVSGSTGDECSSRPTNVSVVVRSSTGYSMHLLDLDVSTSDTEDSLGGYFIGLGNFTFLAAATTTITVDSTGIGSDVCLPVDNVLMRFISSVVEGCMDPFAENYDADVLADDGSCLYLGGRGLSTASWSGMADQYKLDDWYPAEEYETWGTGEYCDVSTDLEATYLESCWHDNCKLHSACGSDAFCCLSSNHEGCSPVSEVDGIDDEGWKLIFRHDINAAGPWEHGVWGLVNETDTEYYAYSLLDQLESFRRPGDGRFEFKACWPDSGFESCQTWIQLLNPMLNPDSTNTHATCTDCPYISDSDPDGDDDFRGLQYNGETHLLDCDSDGSYFQFGAESSTSMYGPQLYNDAGTAEYPTIVELYVRPDPNGNTCVDCRACFDENGEVRMSTYSLSSSPNETYSAPACPDYCLDNVKPEPRQSKIRSTQQLVIASQGLAEMPCVMIISHDDIENEDTNTTICEGTFTTKADAVPNVMEFGRIGGIQTKAFFVAPTTANYTFNTRFNDGGELWLSPNADPRSAQLLISVSHASGSEIDSTSPGSFADASNFYDEWSCLDSGRCFRYFGGRLDFDTSQRACENYGANLATPQSATENSLINGLMGSASTWLGLTDRGKEGYFYSQDGTYRGLGINTLLKDWDYENFYSSEPNDYSNTENCIGMYTDGGWNDFNCFSNQLPFVCELDDGYQGARSTKPITMIQGEVRYLEVIGYNDEDTALSTLTLTIEKAGQKAFTTSDVLGLSAEFLREIRTDQPVIEVVVNDITAACAENGDCSFTYSKALTPLVYSIEPASSTCGETMITFTGEGFSRHISMNEVSIGGAPCDISASNDTYIICSMPVDECTAGKFVPVVNVYNKGHAKISESHEILMQIDSVSPTTGSLYGGMTLTITGSGFARFGLHNQVRLKLKNGETSMPKGTHDIYDDDWLWQRDNVGENGTDSYFNDVLCVPRTLKNRACRYTDDDSGFDCDEDLAWAYDNVRITEDAEWFDFSTPTYIECIVESFGEALTDGTIASLNITIVNTTTLLDTEALSDSIAAAKLNFDCTELSHCVKYDADGLEIGWFGDNYEYTGATHVASSEISFLLSSTPVIESISPTRAMPGQLLDIHGYNFATEVEVTDTNWYMTEFGFYEQPTSVTVTVGTYQCQIKTHNDTLIQCYVVYGDMYEELEVAASIHGVGNAFANVNFTFALDVKSITPSYGSLAGGTTITLETSTLHSEAAGLGISSFDIWFMEDSTYGISQYIANYLGIEQGITCEVVASLTTTASLTCITSAVEDSVWQQPFDTADAVLESWLVAEWNYNEVYSQCLGDCTFSHSIAYTPVLTTDFTMSSLVLPFNGSVSFKSPLNMTWGDELILYRNLSGDIASNFFDWSLVSASDISVTLNNASLEFNFSASDSSVELAVVIGEHVEACVASKLSVVVEPYGNAVVLEGSYLSVLPLITKVSHDFGSMRGGLEVSIEGYALSGDSDVVVGGRPCTDVTLVNSSYLTCLTSDANAKGVSNRGYGIVRVSSNQVPSICLASDVYENDTAVNATDMVFVHSGCEFQFDSNTSHTPIVHHMTKHRGHYPQTFTFVGEGFAKSGNKVKMGYVYAQVLHENSTHVQVQIPKHVAGTYTWSLHVPEKGFSDGTKQWFRFDSGIEDISPKVGSMYGGQRITITGYGFAPAGVLPSSLSSADTDTYASLFSSWVNYGTSNNTEPFDFDSVYATFDTIVATTHFRNLRVVDGDHTMYWMRSLSVDVAQEDVGYIAPNSYYYVVGSDGDSNVENLFDEDPTTVYDGYGGGTTLGVIYHAYSAFLLTDYQVVWRTYSRECPSKWRLYGRESATSDWELVDSMVGPRTQAEDWKYINRTVDNPGYYMSYYWVFEEWAPAYGTAGTSDGHQFRDINLNPNGFAIHYGEQTNCEDHINYEIGLGLTNVAFNKPVYQVSDYNVDYYPASNAVDGLLGLQYLGSTSSRCALTQATSGVNSYMVIDMQKQTTVNRVMVYTLHDSWWRTLLTYGEGLLVGLSDGWDVPYGDPFHNRNHKSWPGDDHRGHYDWEHINEYDCWARQDCDTNTNVTLCGSVTEYANSGQYYVDCPEGNVGRYLFLYQKTANNYLSICEVTAFGIPLGNMTNNTTPEPTSLPTLFPTPHPSVTPSFIPSSSPSQLPSTAPTYQPSFAPSQLPSSAPSQLPSQSPTQIPTSIPSAQPSSLPSMVPTPYPTPSPSATPSIAPTWVPTPQPSALPSASPSQLPSASPSALPTSAPTALPSSPFPSISPSQVPLPSPTQVPSSAPSALPSSIPSAAPTQLPSASPTIIPTPVPSAAPSVTPSFSPSDSPTSLPSSSPSQLPTAYPTDVPFPMPSVAPSLVPSSSPSDSPTSLPSSSPSQLPTAYPTNYPVMNPTGSPTLVPSEIPSSSPSSLPSISPSALPSSLPSSSPSSLPSGSPSLLPSFVPVPAPTVVPTPAPTALPSSLPSALPSPLPTIMPTVVPSYSPTEVPSNSPSLIPTPHPSASPSQGPSSAPTFLPTISFAPYPVPTLSPRPTLLPTPLPTPLPTDMPSYFPTHSPTNSPTTNASCTLRWCPKPILGEVQYETLHVKYQVYIQDSRSRNHDGVFTSGSQRDGISWDDAAELCEKRGMQLAKVHTKAEQSAVVEAIEKVMSYEMTTNEEDAGSEFTFAWLGGKRDLYANWWHWRDDSNIWESNYTNWEDGFSYSDEDYGDYLWYGDDVIGYLCLNAISMEWRDCNVYATGVHAYVCEDRRTTCDKTYKRTYESPLITGVTPLAGMPGTIVTITGEKFNASINDQGISSSGDGSSDLNVTLGDNACSITFANDTLITCVVPKAASGINAISVRNWMGLAGPAELFLFNVNFEVYSISPSRGSLGGGQLVTITGENLPTEGQSMNIAFTTPSYNGTNSSESICTVVNSTYTWLTCLTSAMSDSSLTPSRYNEDGSIRDDDSIEGRKYDADVTLNTLFSSTGDELRLVSQGQFNNFGDHQRPGVYFVSNEVGLEHMVPGGDWLNNNFNLRFGAMFYDPVTRSVVSFCGTNGIFADSDANYCRSYWSTVGTAETDLLSFFKNGSPDYILIVQTHHWWYHEDNQELFNAIASCGGSTSILGVVDYTDPLQYMLVGRCNAGLSDGDSFDMNLEGQHTINYQSIEIQINIFDYFDIELSTNHTSLSYTFDEDVTPYIEWISRKNGTTAGGTTVQLVGSGFTENSTVTLAGITCAVRYEEIGTYRDQHLCDWDGVDCDGIGISEDGTKITCLTNKWDYSGDAFDREVIVNVEGKGNSLSADTVTWSYANLWSSTTTWGGNDPPVEGDSVVITYGEYIILDISPPELVLLTIQGNLEFARDVGDLALNCSYIVLHYGRLFVGTADEPFETHNAVITLVGDRNSYELPVYGAKTIAVRTAELYLHGRHRVSWTKLAKTAGVGNTTLVLRDDTDWEVGDHIFVSSTEHQMLQAEECYISAVSSDGRVIEITKPLIYAHWGEGWTSEDGKHSMDGYRASVGLLTRNVVVQGDHIYSKAEQFGAQIVLSTESNTEDNPLKGMMSNVEVRQAGQGLKLGKYPIHFHMVGNVSESYIKNCSVHHTFNRGITIHGVDNLLVEYNVIFDTRGHTIFTEDGTERFNIIRYNLVSVVRPIWSLLMVDQSPACFWIVNPTNDVYGNVAAGSSHYGFWFRALPSPDGVSGAANDDAGLVRCPNWAELGKVEDNTAHSTGRHGMKVSNFFPVKGGYFCPTDAVPEPATFKNFTSFKNRHMGIWGEFIVDVNFDTLLLADHVKSGIEFKYINGRSAKFATSVVTNALFVGNMYDDILTPESDQCALRGNCPGPLPVGNDEHGWFYPSNGDLGNGFTHAINLPGIGSQLEVRNATFINYQAAMYGCSWCVAHRGGYEMEFWNVSMTNVEHIAHFKHGIGGILVDGDGSLGTGVAGGTVVPPTGQWRTNSNCSVDPTGRYTKCGGVVRRVNVAIEQWTSPWWDTNIKKHYPLLIATDITEETLDSSWDKWNRALDETRVSCLSDAGCGLYHYGTPVGAQACFEQAPKMKYSFLGQIGRRYLITWVDQNFIRTTADVAVSVTKMRSDEVMIMQFSHRPPLYPRLPMRASVSQGSVELWGELEPRLGAWSPPPNLPIYDEYYDDHGGDSSQDPCASGTYVSKSHSGSCWKGDGYYALELDEDPDIGSMVISNYESFNSYQRADVELPVKIAASGRTNEGGLLHPKSGGLTYSGSISASNAQAYQYRGYCATLDSQPSVEGGVKVAMQFCLDEVAAFGSGSTNLQRFKFGYDWTGDWESNFGQEEIWNLALDEESALPVHEQPLTIVLAYNPIYCLDVRNASYTNSEVVINVCDIQLMSQNWFFNESTGEIVNYGAKSELGLNLCLGWGSPSSSTVWTSEDAKLRLKDCDGSYKWDEEFYLPTSETTPMHGSFYFDPYRNWNTRGLVQPQNVHNLTSSKDLYKTISSWPASKSYYDYDVWNTSVMSVVFAGNTTLTIETNSCPPEGCSGYVPSSDTVANFMWSDNATWASLNESVPCDHDPTASHGNRMCSHNYPCGCADVTIWDGWTVTLDMITPFMNTLTIRGTLIVQYDSNISLALHANLINIKGGRLIIGNSTHPFQGPMMQVYLHGDMYFHGKECTNPYDTYVTEFGCWKQMIVNGELSFNGKEVEVTRTLVADAARGSNSLHLDEPVTSWKSGDDLVLSSSNSGGQPEYHTVDYVSEDGLTVYLTGTLARARIGTVVTVSDASSGLKETVLDGRATVSHLTRNIEFRGGYDLTYDYISGVGPDLTDYGATIRLQEAWSEDREGWDDSMVGYDLYGVYNYPDGYISNMNYVRFRGAGKQYDLEPPAREPPLVLHTSLTSLTMVGIVVTEPLTGKFFECTKVGAYKGATSLCSTKATSKTITDSVFVGTAIDFAPGTGRTDVAERNIFFGGEECRTDCPSVKMVVFGGNGGTLSVVNNTAYGGFGGFTLRAPCSDYQAWGGNVAMGNSVGFDVEAGCTSLFLEGYRNSAGITANTAAISNFLMVENGMAVTPGKWITWPDVKNNLPPDVLSGGSELALISDGIIIGKTPSVTGSVRSSSCEKWTGGGNHPWSKGFKLGGTLTGFRWFTEYGYSGFAANGAYVAKQGTGYDDLKTRSLYTDEFSRLAYYGVGGTSTATFQYVLNNIKFYGFSGKDTCGRRNVAISNEMSSDGEGTARAFGAHFGKVTCYPINVQNSTFTETPDYARLRFSEGPTTPEVQYGLCLVYDDGSIMGDSAYLDAGIGPYILKSAKKHEWPAEVLRDCQSWASLGYADDYDGAGTCLWWLRTYDNVQGAITDSSRRGMIETGVKGTQYPSGFCEEIFTADSKISNNVQLCSGMEYVILKTFVPEKKVSGSEILYGPVGYINIKDSFYGSSTFAGASDTVVDIYRDYTDPRGDQIPPQTGKETEQFNPVLSRYTQPYLATLVNHGYYRIQYTGDITLFDEDFLEYQLVSLTDSPQIEEDFTVIVDIKFLKAVNLAFYYDGRQVAQSPRRDKITLDAQAGTNYLDPVSKILSFVVKGTVSPVRIRQLKVVSVAFGIVSTFDSFFEDNFIDPNAIDASFADMVPPTYAANYDPDNGNIVKSNTFVRNLASVLNINPARIRVVNIVPGNRRRLMQLVKENPDKYQHHIRRLDETGDDGEDSLGVDFEISSVDTCEDVVCVHGDCNTLGTCDCDSGYVGDICNTTFVNCSDPAVYCPDPTLSPSYSPTFLPTDYPSLAPSQAPSRGPSQLPTSAPTSTHAPTSGTPYPTMLPSFHPTRQPTLLPTSYPTSVPTVQAVSLSNFAELISVATTLSTAAGAGTLDTGYTISEAIVSLPEDECGVAGGDSTTCDDACGVINGDNSTCADACGVPNGDGTSCIDTSAGFYTCDHAATTGIMNERQAILIRGTNMLGLFSLSFNGKATEEISVFSSTDTILEALTNLDTVGSLTIDSNITEASSGSGVSAIDIYVEFSRETGTYPYHHGKQPLIEVDTSGVSGEVTYADVSRVCEGTFRTGYSFDEQRISVTSDSDTNFTLLLNASGEYKGAYGVTPDIPMSASSYVFSEQFAAMQWYGLGEDVAYELDRSYFEVFVNGTASWIIRFYFAPNSDALRITVLGDVPTILDGKLAKNITVDDNMDEYVLSSRSLSKGLVPSAAMPISATAAASASGSSAVTAAETIVETTMGVVEVVHVCGNSARTSVEGCDDGNTDDGDGCSRNCTVETGFVCTNSIGVISVCSVPANPTLYFESTLFGPFAEGGEGYATVRRMGNNMTEVSVTYSVSGSTAVSTAAENDDCATAGDFNNTGGVITFPVGVTSVDIAVEIYEDNIWEQALSTYERFVVSLVSSSDADIDSTRSVGYVRIEDKDASNYTLGWCLTDAPSLVPTVSPTHVPSPQPTHAPSLPPSPQPSLLPTVSLLPSSLPSPLPTVSLAPTPQTFEPTSLPTTKPSALPTSQPSTPPTASPTNHPSQLPTYYPTPVPYPSPSSVPVPAPTSSPSLPPTSVPSPLWIGLVVEARSSVSLNGFTSASEFDRDQQLLFATALDDSIDMITDVSQINITSVDETSVRKLKRHLLATTLTVDYTLTIPVQGATSVDDVSISLTSQLKLAFNDTSGTSSFATSLAAYATSLNISTSASVDVQSTLSSIGSLSVSVLSVSTAQPSQEPTVVPSEVPTSPTSMPTKTDKSAKKDNDDDALYLVGGVSAGVLILLGVGLLGYKRTAAKNAKKVAPMPNEEDAKHSTSSFRPKTLPTNKVAPSPTKVNKPSLFHDVMANSDDEEEGEKEGVRHTASHPPLKQPLSLIIDPPAQVEVEIDEEEEAQEPIELEKQPEVVVATKPEWQLEKESLEAEEEVEGTDIDKKIVHMLGKPTESAEFDKQVRETLDEQYVEKKKQLEKIQSESHEEALEKLSQEKMNADYVDMEVVKEDALYSNIKPQHHEIIQDDEEVVKPVHVDPSLRLRPLPGVQSGGLLLPLSQEKAAEALSLGGPAPLTPILAPLSSSSPSSAGREPLQGKGETGSEDPMVALDLDDGLNEEMEFKVDTPKAPAPVLIAASKPTPAPASEKEEEEDEEMKGLIIPKPNGFLTASEEVLSPRLRSDSNMLLALRSWKHCRDYLNLYRHTVEQAFEEIDWNNKGVITEYKFNEWTKKHVGIASRIGSVERFALWAFLVDARDPLKKPTYPLLVEGDHIRDATLDLASFNLAVSRLVKLQEELDAQKAVTAINTFSNL